jgi:hypothetical protein
MALFKRSARNFRCLFHPGSEEMSPFSYNGKRIVIANSHWSTIFDSKSTYPNKYSGHPRLKPFERLLARLLDPWLGAAPAHCRFEPS